jgi:hexaprenyl-diphosphate synthase
MLGKRGGADLNLGLATGPALYAWEEHQEMGELIQRNLSGLSMLSWCVIPLFSV